MQHNFKPPKKLQFYQHHFTLLSLSLSFFSPRKKRSENNFLVREKGRNPLLHNFHVMNRKLKSMMKSILRGFIKRKLKVGNHKGKF